MDFENDLLNYKRIEKAITFLVQNQQEQPSLSDLSSELAISEFHLQRLFQDWAGVSPKQFLQFLTKEYAKSLLPDLPVSEVAYEAGLSSSSRLYDLMIKHESVTPGEFRERGRGLTIRYGWARSPFGNCFMACCERGICKLGFFDTQEEREVLANELQEQYQQAELVHDQTELSKQIGLVFGENNHQQQARLYLRGTPFRIKVWEALLKIPEGEVRSYQDIAVAIGQPTGSRAVASAIANNPVGLLVPCHRVIRSTGVISGYRWGEMRKRALLLWEQGRKKNK